MFQPVKHGINRRTLLQWGMAGAGMALLPMCSRADAGGASVRNAVAQPVSASGPQTQYDLSIGKKIVNFSGKNAEAVTVNNSLPGPLLHFREGDTVTINVTNTLPEITAVHWHGLLLPNAMDGVPGITFPGIHQGETFQYQFKLRQNGTYWYHSHNIFQEPAGFYAPLIIDSATPEPFQYEREYVVLLSDWIDTPAAQVLANLKKVSGYYNYRRQTLLDLRKQLNAAKSDEDRAAIWRERLMWAQMRMDPTDITDGGPEWQFLMHGQTAANNWTALLNHGERIRLRIINGASLNFFDLSIPGLSMTVVAADGIHVQPIAVNELRIGVGETYDVIIAPTENKAYTIFAATSGRIGFARGTLAPAPGMEAPIPELGPQPVLTMADMAGVHDHSAHVHAAHNSAEQNVSTHDHAAHDHAATSSAAPVHRMMVMPNGVVMDEADMAAPESTTDKISTATAPLPSSGADKQLSTIKSVAKLNYADLRALTPSTDTREPTKIIDMQLTGDMERYVWTINGKKMDEARFFEAKLGERLRVIITNATMMEHPMHVHGAFFEFENIAGDTAPEYRPRKHTLIIKPGQTVNLLTRFDEVGVWMFHCHLTYHALAGMMQAVVVTRGESV